MRLQQGEAARGALAFEGIATGAITQEASLVRDGPGRLGVEEPTPLEDRQQASIVRSLGEGSRGLGLGLVARPAAHQPAHELRVGRAANRMLVQAALEVPSAGEQAGLQGGLEHGPLDRRPAPLAVELPGPAHLARAAPHGPAPLEPEDPPRLRCAIGVLLHRERGARPRGPRASAHGTRRCKGLRERLRLRSRDTGHAQRKPEGRRAPDDARRAAPLQEWIPSSHEPHLLQLPVRLRGPARGQRRAPTRASPCRRVPLRQQWGPWRDQPPAGPDGRRCSWMRRHSVRRAWAASSGSRIPCRVCG